MDLVVTIDAIAEGTSGMGDEIGRTIDASSALVDVAARHADDIRQFLGDVALLSDTFATRGDDFLATLGHADQLLDVVRSEEHTSELPSLMCISYAVFCLKKKNSHK